MKLAILCGSLEPGKDGVGDYSRQLANYCREEGHSVLLVSLNDSWVELDNIGTQEMRLSSSQSWTQRSTTLEKALTAFQPDWVSLQFVPYAYQKRGFCQEMAAALGTFAKKFRWHLMFHELWLGLNPGDSLKYKILGWWQRRGVLQLVRSLSPALVHTHATAYANFLQSNGIAATRLPLFSNIDIELAPDFPKFYELLARRECNLTPLNREHTFVAIFFGSLHPEWTPDGLMEKLAGKKLLFLSMGRLGHTGTQIWNDFADKYATRAQFLNLGELSASEISTALQFADAGVAASPWNLIEKSGSVAAMIEHGLPVLVTRNDFLPDQQLELTPTLARHLHPIWKDNVNQLSKNPPSPRLPEIGSQFLADLHNRARLP
ncbi:MAG: glycosyltransferase [Chthoniobacterales bacterium]